MVDKKFSNLKRPVHPMPDFVREALTQHNLMDVYRDRPAYQQNDYLRWITSAKRQETIDKRLKQMLEELKNGDKYMKMSYHPRSR